MTVFCKISGAVLTVASAVLTARIMAARERTVTVQISGFLRLFRTLRSGIAYDRAPISDLLSRVDRETAEACSGRGTAVYGESLAEWVAACDLLSESLAALLSRAVGELGRGYREDQIAVCDRYIEALEAQYRESAARLREHTKLVGTLLPTVAAGAVLLLI